MYLIKVTESEKDHTGKNHSGFINFKGEFLQFIDLEHAKSWIEHEDNKDFLNEFITIEIVKK